MAKRNLVWYIKGIKVMFEEYIDSTKKIIAYEREIRNIEKNMKFIKSFSQRRDNYEKEYLKYTDLVEIGLWERKTTFDYFRNLIFKRG